MPWLGGEHSAQCLPDPRRLREPGWEDVYDSRPHRSPGLRCECGVRGDRSLPALLGYGVRLALVEEAVRTEDPEVMHHARAARGASPAWLLSLPERFEPEGGPLGWRDSLTVIGEVDMVGRCRPPRRDDTPTALWAARGRVGERLFFPRPLWDYASDFERVHPWSTAVRIGTLHQVLDH